MLKKFKYFDIKLNSIYLFVVTTSDKSLIFSCIYYQDLKDFLKNQYLLLKHLSS